MYKLSNYTDYRQLFVLIITIILNLSVLLINVLSDNKSLFLCIICIVVSLLLNLINSILYDVSIVGKKILVKSLYKKQEIIEAKEFCEIQNANKFYLFVFYTS